MCYLDAESIDSQNFLRTLAGWEAVSFRSVVYRKGKAGECFSMLDSEKQKHRDHCKAFVVRFGLVSALELMSEPQSGEFCEGRITGARTE